MKKTFLLILCAVLLFSTALAETATVTVNGVGEHVTVTLTMDGDRIAGVEASSDNTEADARGKESLALITKEMVSANSFSVDTISGATCTSNAVIAGAIEAWLQIMTDRMSQEEWMQESFKYEHDPRDNPKAMKDIVYNPAAVYGFSPSPDSTRLKAYVDALDWTNPDQVAEARAVRQAYHDSMSELYRMIERMLERGGQSVFLMLCTVVDGKGNPMKEGPKLDELVKRMGDAVRRSIRRGDAMCQYGRGQYLALLINTTRENCSVIQKRINYHFIVGRQRSGIKYYVNSVFTAPPMELSDMSARSE